MIATALTIPAATRNQVEAMHRRGDSPEHLLAKMREAGLPKPQSIRLLAEVTEISLGQSKQAVHDSPVWRERRNLDDAFHESLLEAAKNADILHQPASSSR